MIFIAGDKHGYTTINCVEEFLRLKNLKYKNLGVSDKSQDIPLEEMIPRVVRSMKKNDLAILSCGTGVGVQIGANRFADVRACLATNEEIATWSRVYDNSNVLCLAGWNFNKKETLRILEAWLAARYDGNRERMKMLKVFDKWH